MAKQHPIEIFMPPNILKAKVGGGSGGLDMAAVKRAEAAVQTLKGEFTDWVGADVEQLGKARDQFAATPTIAARDSLFRAGHDMKGQASTFDFPLIARISSSLCKLIDELKAPDAIPLTLVDAHVDAIRVIYRQKIRDGSDRMALTLAEELEGRTRDALQRAPHA